MIICFVYNFIIRPLKVIWTTQLINVLFPAFLNYSCQMVLYLCYCLEFPAEVVWLLKKNMWWHHKITVIELLGMLEHSSLLSLLQPHLGNKFVNKVLWHLIECLMWYMKMFRASSISVKACRNRTLVASHSFMNYKIFWVKCTNG